MSTTAVMALILAATSVSFVMTSDSVDANNTLLLRQDAAQGALLLRYVIGQVPAAIYNLSGVVQAGGVDLHVWKASAPNAMTSAGESGLAIVKMDGNRLSVIASVGLIHRIFGTSADVPVAQAVEAGNSTYYVAVGNGSSRWAGQVFGSPTVAHGYALYGETAVSNAPVSLTALAGHPFANVDAAVYIGSEQPDNLVLTTTRSLPITGTRAVTVMPGGSALASAPVANSKTVGSKSAPGSLLVVMRAKGSLAGTSSTVLPWVLLLGGILTAFLVTLIFAVTERRRGHALALAAKLEERNDELDQAVARSKRTDARFSAMIRSSSDLTTVIDDQGRINYQSPSSYQLLGQRPERLVGTSFFELLHADDSGTLRRALQRLNQYPDTEYMVQWRMRTIDDGYASVESRMSNLLDNAAVAGIVINSRDVSDRMRLETELRHQAFHDSLTGLANRALFHDRVEHALATLSRTGGAVGVLFLDLDDFKAVNDARGHRVGDEMLRAVSGRLRNTVRAGDTLARLGGDEFAVLVEATDPAGAAEWGERILDAFKVPFALAGGASSVRASIGIASCSEGSITVEELLRNADIAMYAAKNAGKGRSEIFHEGLHAQVIDRVQLEADLACAVSGDEIAVHYQAIVDLKTGDITGVEALMRWNHPRRGLVMPTEFVPMAESTGLIVPLGRWLLGRACADARMIQEECERFDFHLAVNISARQLDDPGLVGDVSRALADSGLLPGLLTLEITESVFMADPDHALAVLQELKALGVKLSIDDFGTGYSSLAYLQHLPVNELKIDRTFVTDEGGPEPGALVKTIVRLASTFGLTTVAEGIETEAQMIRMREAGCLQAQGFLFARPVDVSEMRAVMAHQDGHPTLMRSTMNMSVSSGAMPAPGERGP